MFKLPSLRLNTSPCWQQREIPWSAVRWESAILLESKQRVCQLEIIFCLLGPRVVAWWSRVTVSDSRGVGNRKQAEKWGVGSAADNRSFKSLTLCYCYRKEKTPPLTDCLCNFSSSSSVLVWVRGTFYKKHVNKNIPRRKPKETHQNDTQRSWVGVDAHRGEGGQISFLVLKKK